MKCASFLCLTVIALASTLIAETDTPEMTEARVMGVTVLQLMQENLKDRDPKDAPGISAW